MTQDELSTLIELAPVAVGVFESADHRGVLANRRLLELLGGRELLGRPLRAALPEPAAEPCLALLDRAFTRGERGALVEHPTVLPDGSGAPVERFCTITVEPIRDEAGRVTRTMLIVNDVSETVRSRRAIAGPLTSRHATTISELRAHLDNHRRLRPARFGRLEPYVRCSLVTWGHH